MAKQLPITIEVVGDRDARRRLKNLTGPPLTRVLKDASAHAQVVAKKGLLGSLAANSITTEVKPTTARVFSMMAEPRVLSIEAGRAPGGNLIHPDALARWISRVGYHLGPYVLARHIQRRGVKGRFFMKAAIQSTRGQLPHLMRRMGRDVEKRYGRRRLG